MSEERRQVLQRTLDSRTRYMTILTENTYHAQNASALVRHCEAFGVQDIHTIETRCKFNPNVNIVRARTNGSTCTATALRPRRSPT